MNLAYSLARPSSIDCNLFVTYCPNVESASIIILSRFVSLKYSGVGDTSSPVGGFKSIPTFFSFLDFKGFSVDLIYGWFSLFSSSYSTCTADFQRNCPGNPYYIGVLSVTKKWN